MKENMLLLKDELELLKKQDLQIHDFNIKNIYIYIYIYIYVH